MRGGRNAPSFFVKMYNEQEDVCKSSHPFLAIYCRYRQVFTIFIADLPQKIADKLKNTAGLTTLRYFFYLELTGTTICNADSTYTYHRSNRTPRYNPRHASSSRREG